MCQNQQLQHIIWQQYKSWLKFLFLGLLTIFLLSYFDNFKVFTPINKSYNYFHFQAKYNLSLNWSLPVLLLLQAILKTTFFKTRSRIDKQVLFHNVGSISVPWYNKELYYWYLAKMRYKVDVYLISIWCLYLFNPILMSQSWKIKVK
jgi:hypothetical protein